MAITTVNPATGQELQTYALQSAGEVQAVVDRSRAAFSRWRDVACGERAQLLKPLAERLRLGADRHARLMVTEMGKPLTEALAEVEKCAWLCDFYAERAPGWLADRTVQADGLEHRVIFQPLGIVLSIMPWNYPYWQALRFAVPTLTAGNTSILKHASNVTGCGLALAELFAEARFPEHVFQSLVADYQGVQSVLERPEVRGVSLTGSTRVGVQVAQMAATGLKKVVLELGGSDPFVVLEDADLDQAVQGAVTGRMLCTGQSCIAAKRFIVARPLAAEFAERMATAMAALKVGDPLDEGTRVGAIANSAELARLAEFVADAVKLGARLLTGGSRIDRPGSFFAPTVLADVSPQMRVFREEVFGPIAPVVAFDNEAEAVALANATQFGLGGSVWTRDLERGEVVARRLECGTAFVNSIVKSDPRMPFGGVKMSGLGRELGRYGLMEFVNIKGLNIYSADS
ncbi:NAD-dependent succinate-semialdehyde dehydrogenase [bacterium]|nr:NAD-dependent succinate-semialdehyde dehydrogenase [bacterium]PJA75664.1 MAG: NADP-dependent succinic semialdehyde dehydrogenase [bacterium CG_4_9_14_3_um_filter_65_15]